MDKLDNHLKDIESKQNYHLQFLIVLFHHLEMDILSYIYWQHNRYILQTFILNNFLHAFFLFRNIY